MQPVTATISEDEAFPTILHALARATGIDFAGYKAATIQRRVHRRMLAQHAPTLSSYAAFVAATPTEAVALAQDLLITVTDFFRDPSAFQALRERVFPALCGRADQQTPIRVWAVGCATGEEVYSLAMCWMEFAAERGITQPIRFFGTDLNTQAIDDARAGLYPAVALSEVSSERVQQFFSWQGDRYRISKASRDCCTFAVHNVCQDPPFSRIDLLVCRNLLIYLRVATQRRVLQNFHYALNPQGFLLLGISETVGRRTDLFQLIENHATVYVRKDTASRLFYIAPTSTIMIQPEKDTERESTMPHPPSSNGDALSQADRLLLARYVPASVVVNTDLEILQFHGPVGPYLAPTGKASLQILKMVRDDLALDLRSVLHTCQKHGHAVKKEGISLLSDGVPRVVDIEVLPLKGAETFLIIITESPAAAEPQETAPPPTAPSSGETGRAKDRHVKRLEQELVTIRTDMHAIVEELEAANEKLQAANEEILSSNEELQSTNEELETSKEELQASNEELQVQSEHITMARDYADAIIATIHEPLVVLDATLHVLRANPAFYQTFHLAPHSIEQQNFYDLCQRQWDIPTLRQLLEDVLPRNHTFQGVEVTLTIPTTTDTRTMLCNGRRLSCETHADTQILLVMQDITERKRLEEQKDTFLSIASHELKTPLTALKGYIQILERQLRPGGEEKLLKTLATIDEQLGRQTRLVDELLDVTKLAAGPFPLQKAPFEVDVLVHEVVELFQQSNSTHQIVIAEETHATVEGDRERTWQILTNLLSNATKYAPPEHPVIVREQADADDVTLSVQDFGRGIPAVDQAHLFERFYRSSETKGGRIPGLGLGLYIASELVKLQGGHIWVHSREGEGSTFFFTLPRQQQGDKRSQSD